MPLVFVHGVNTRRGETLAEQRVFDDRIELMKHQFGGTAFADRVTAADGLRTFTPYWGDLGIKFARNLASLPKSGVQTLALAQPAFADLAAATSARLDPEVARDPVAAADPLLAVAKSRSLQAAVDLLFAGATNAPKPPMLAKALTAALPDAARFAQAAERYAAANPAPPWLATAPNDAAFVQELYRAAKDAAAIPTAPTADQATDTQTLAIGDDVLTWLKNGASAIKGTVKDAAAGVKNALTGAATDVARTGFLELSGYVRPNASAFAGRFVGDAFTYMQNRIPIIARVLDCVREADKARRPGDQELYLIGHSFGGIILYDILTHFASDIHCDLYVTVGSQVAFFAEIGRLAADKDLAAAFEQNRPASRPGSAARWINIYDLTDIFGFGTIDVFTGAKDYKFETDALPLVSHAAYFDTPRFFARLRERVFDAFAKGTDE
ncbi:hypothetical protein [Bradyrhizobium sp. CCBAU 25360]|uniref:hypothetical protein n=1 Tax=Bradyrhizobium sp. CCBAU 25360 TaxID=858425 RepID=UPI0023050774|nr:hypothetical protein [Bradyrhizobium sp. CCBAU 25360]